MLVANPPSDPDQFLANALANVEEMFWRSKPRARRTAVPWNPAGWVDLSKRRKEQT